GLRRLCPHLRSGRLTQLLLWLPATEHSVKLTLLAQQTGFALLDGLIAILILVVGILGLLKMSITLVQANVQSRYRVEATFFAEQLLGMAIADPTNVSCYAVNPAQSCGSGTAQNSAGEWLRQVQASLPGGSATSGRIGTDGTFSVSVSWQRAADGDS